VPALAHNAPIPAAARVGPLVCTSAINGKDAATGSLPPDGPTQVRNAFANLRTVLHAAGAELRHVAKLAITLQDDSLRGAINAEWNACFPQAHDRPARHISAASLQHGMLIQLEATAFVTD
jgi:2-iminobutanoate/2-iminopropanoate deaminase